jgi:threonine dehydrogenase-like Zn-dependent dehydrogenase
MSRTEYQVVFTRREQAELLDLPVSAEPLGPNEVSGRTVATLISAGTELAGYQGLWRWAEFPITPGYAAAFTVEAVGSEVTDLKPGDLAFTMGRHCTLQRANRADVVPVPAGVTPEMATFARLMNVTMTTMTHTNARPGDKVIITGLGLVGHLAAKNFIRCGYDVYGVDTNPARRAMAEAGGIAQVLSAVPLDDPAMARKVALVVECSGHEQAVLDACKVVRRRGEVILVAAPWRKQSDVSAHEIQHQVFFEYVDLRSGWEWELPHHAETFRPHSIFGNLATCLRWLAEGTVSVDGLYTTMRPQDVQAAYQGLQNGSAQRLAVVLDWREVSA